MAVEDNVIGAFQWDIAGMGVKDLQFAGREIHSLDAAAAIVLGLANGA